ncbi:parp-1 [Pristionchus pacificus]|nr:parp-1 [Pristionchus pacificus]
MDTNVSGANLPYAAKYEKDCNAKCTKCKKTIPVGDVILGLRESNAAGQHTDRWYHVNCFFVAMQAKGVGVTESAIRGMSWLKWDDQESIRDQIDAFNGQTIERMALDQCKVEHAASHKGKCGKCKNNIKKDEAKYLCKKAFHHLPCLMKLDIKFTGDPADVGGYDKLLQPEKDALKKAIDEQRYGKIKTEATQGSASDCLMGGDEGGEADGAADAPVVAIVAMARRMARNKKDSTTIYLNALDTETALERSAPATLTASTKTAWGDDYDGEIQLLDVVKSGRPPVVTLGGGGAEGDDEKGEKKMEQKKMWDEVEVMEDDEPPKPKKSSLNRLFDRFQQEKRESLSSVLDLIPKKPRLSAEMSKDQLNDQLKKQTDALWTLREKFDALHEDEIVDLMKRNGMYVPEGKEMRLNSICDAALFGVPGQCPKCPDGRFIFNSDLNTYVCMGNMTEWTKCTHTEKNPKYRTPFGFPRDLPSALAKKLEPVDDTELMNTMSRRYYPIANGAPLTKGLPSVAAISAEEAAGGSKKQAVAAPATGGKQVIKRGTVVDGECIYAPVAHVYRDDDGTLFTCSLTQTDLASNMNSYYKMQLLEHDTDSDLFYVFKSWGRVGTELGGLRTEVHSRQGALDRAKADFLGEFMDKTGNDWTDKKYFRKRPGKYAMVDIDYSEIEKSRDDEVKAGSITKLDKPVQSLVTRFFDKSVLMATLQSFDLDMDQMPLGKLSKQQLGLANRVLKELQALLSQPNNAARVVDATNRFYTLLPHNFGLGAPEMINTKAIIEKKAKLIENLTDIAIAVDLMQDKNDNGTKTMDPIDVNYLKLKSKITLLPRSHPDFAMIEKYAKNSHGSTHDTKIAITDVFCVARDGEGERFNAALGNRMLLWHGSRLSNFVGILSQGLRIAPPEAPATGYMFGKGIYFADMISKSANYCHPQLSQDDAFLLLCDVALGQIQEETNATGNNPLKNGCNAVKGMGYQFPDPSNVHVHDEGFVVPYGKATRGLHKICLDYNEFIVYDMSQVRIRYLVRTKMTNR